MSEGSRGWEADAAEFGLLVRAGRWRLGLLVARSVEPGTGTGGNSCVARRTDDGKISAREFARAAGTSADRVLRHLRAWDLAAEDGLVAASRELMPGQEVSLAEGEGLLPAWESFYARASADAQRAAMARSAAARREAASAAEAHVRALAAVSRSRERASVTVRQSQVLRLASQARVATAGVMAAWAATPEAELAVPLLAEAAWQTATWGELAARLRASAGREGFAQLDGRPRFREPLAGWGSRAAG